MGAVTRLGAKGADGGARGGEDAGCEQTNRERKGEPAGVRGGSEERGRQRREGNRPGRERHGGGAGRQPGGTDGGGKTQEGTGWQATGRGERVRARRQWPAC